MPAIIAWLSDTSNWMIGFTAIVFLLQLAFLYRRSLKDLTIGYRVAVLGLPRAGKTALIGAIFNEIFSSSDAGVFAPVGQETINRVNKIITFLDSRKTLAPTRESDVFVFRFLYYIRNKFLFRPIRYEGEVVDFPGELSEKLLDSSRDGSFDDDISLFHKEFYSWVLSSKVHIFAIDLAEYLISNDRAGFVAKSVSEIRATWQLLNEEANRSLSSPNRKVALVFTKSDLLSLFRDSFLSDDEKKQVQKYGYNEGPSYGAIRAARGNSEAELIAEVEWRFAELIAYFARQDCQFEHFFVTSYRTLIREMDGMHRLIRFILPGKGPIRSPSGVARAALGGLGVPSRG